MKIIITLLIGMMSFSAFAEIGDKYSIAAKTNRASEDLGLIEIIGMTVLWDHDDDPMTASYTVKAALDFTELADTTDISMTMGNILGGVRDDKLMVQIVYNPQDVDYSTDCLGADFYVSDPSTPLDLTDKSCFVVKAKDILLK
jgi:hypothetical protein